MALSIAGIFQNPTLVGLTHVVRGGSTPHNPIPRRPIQEPVEQSFAQGRLWFLDQLNLERDVVASYCPIAIRMQGPLDISALTAAIQALEQRHETQGRPLRSRDGVGMQVVLKGAIRKS